MKTWVVTYKNKETLEELEEMFEVQFKPIFEHLNFVFVNTNLPKEEIEKISGVTNVREEWIGTFLLND